MPDQEIQCADCGQTFTFTAGEQEFYAGRNMSPPKRCKNCREARKAGRDGGERSGGRTGGRR